MKKRRKLNKLFLTFLIIITLFTISLTFFTTSILSLVGIETLWRTLGLALLFIIYISYFIVGVTCATKRWKKTLIIFSIVVGIIIPILSVASYYIGTTYSKIDSINKDTIIYSSSLIIKNDYKFKDEKNVKVAMISDTEDIEGYKLAKKLLEKEKLKNIEIVSYDDYLEMIDDFLNDKVNAILASSNYLILFTQDDIYDILKNNTKILYSYSEEHEKKESTNTKKLTEPFSLLLVGVDGSGNVLNTNQSFNGDTLMVITFNPSTLNATMFSIPRDTYVPIACKRNAKNKINTAAYSGMDCVTNTIENLIDIDIDYYVKMNFKGVVDLVNAIDGVTVEVPYSFCEQNSKREFGNSTIYVEEGIQTLDGEQALALSRNRHCWPKYCEAKYNTSCSIRNDFKRGQNQQLVVTGIAQKIKTIRSVKELYSVLDAISNNMDTNITTKQLLSLYDVAKNIFTKSLKGSNDFINIDKTYLTGYDQYINGLYYFIHYESSLEEIVNAMKLNLNLTEAEPITNFEFNINNVYEKKIIGKTYSSNQAKIETVPKFRGQTMAYVNEWGLKNNITITYEEVDNTNPLYEENLADGYIVGQSIKATRLLSGITNITIYIIKNT